jgi:uncharacterized protein
MISRRHLMCCGAGLAAGLFTSLGAAQAKRLGNPCRGRLPPRWQEHEIVQAAFAGIDTRRLIDTHAHLLGTGDSGSGCSVNAKLYDWWHPLEVLRRRAIMDAACVLPGAASIDRAYVHSLSSQAADFPPGARWWLYAFEHALDDRGNERAAWSTFHVPNEYAADVAAAAPERFNWVASIHPYREDALERLHRAAAAGAVAMKWLPSAMNIELRDARCRPFYEALVRHGLPLVVHSGEEKAVPGAGRDELGNPLLLRAPLQAGVTVIAAHCASLGVARDIDQRAKRLQQERPAFELFARLMDERGHAGRLLGDVSAVFQRNRPAAVWRELMRRDDWHERLVHGSDHPLPGVMPLFSTEALVRAGLLGAADVEPLAQIRGHNPLLFDFVLKRRLALGTHRLPASVFEAHALSVPA